MEIKAQTKFTRNIARCAKVVGKALLLNIALVILTGK
jgi:hypothetical protein